MYWCCNAFGSSTSSTSPTSNDCCLLKIYCYNVLWNGDNLVRSQLCNHHLNQLQFFECFYILLDHFLLADQKIFFYRSQHCNVLFLSVAEKITCILFGMHFVQMIKQKLYLLSKNLGQLSNLNIILLILIPVSCSFKTWFQLL